jgi:hypothetical protein
LRIRAGAAGELRHHLEEESSFDDAHGEDFSTVLETTLDLPTGQLLLDTSAGTQVSLEDLLGPIGTCHVRVRNPGGLATVRIQDAHLDADTDELIEQVGPEEWTVDMYR